MDGVTPGQLVTSIFAAGTEMDSAQGELEDALHAEVDALEALTKAKAAAYRNVQGRNREEREAYVDEMCVDEIVENKRQSNKVKGLMQKVLNKRQALSSYQTASKSLSEESQHSRIGPDHSSMSDMAAASAPAWGQ